MVLAIGIAYNNIFCYSKVMNKTNTWNKGNRKYSGVCPTCKTIWHSSSSRKKYCCHKCYLTSDDLIQRLKIIGKIGNSVIKPNGVVFDRKYKMIYSPTHPFANKSSHKGYVYEHRLIMESILLRYLEPNEIIHHINGDPQDNRPENLVLTNRKLHAKHHHKERKILNGQFIK